MENSRDGTERLAYFDRCNDANGEITVIQKESALSVDEDKTIPAIASLDNTFIFKATKGLSWSVSEEMDWLTLLGTTDGTNNTTGSDQTITYSVLINPNESARNGNIEVKAGNISKSITVEQAGSSFSGTGGEEKIATTGGTTTGSVKATSGLAWTITPETDNDITVSPTSGSGDVTLEFSASDNAGSERMGTFIVSLDANQERTITITATQTGKDTGAYIGNLQVCLTDEDSSNFGTASTNCSKSTKEGKTGWHLPTKYVAVHE